LNLRRFGGVRPRWPIYNLAAAKDQGFLTSTRNKRSGAVPKDRGGTSRPASGPCRRTCEARRGEFRGLACGPESAISPRRALSGLLRIHAPGSGATWHYDEYGNRGCESDSRAHLTSCAFMQIPRSDAAFLRVDSPPSNTEFHDGRPGQVEDQRGAMPDCSHARAIMDRIAGGSTTRAPSGRPLRSSVNSCSSMIDAHRDAPRAVASGQRPDPGGRT